MSQDKICPSCKGNWSQHNNECISCEKGVIPSRVLEFISKNMSEDSDNYICQYNHIPMPGNPSVDIQVNFKIGKSNYAYYALNVSNTPWDFPRNTVKLIDKMASQYTDGEYLKIV